MTILAVDTSLLTHTVVGLYFSDTEQLEYTLVGPQSQSEKLAPAIDAGLNLLHKTLADVEYLAVCVGPGSFTGLRIGLSYINALAWAGSKKLAGVSTLHALAASQAAFSDSDTLVVPVLDARMKRVFASLYSGGQPVTPERDLTPDDLLQLIASRPEKRVLFCGDGAAKYPALLTIDGKTVTVSTAGISGLVLCRLARNAPLAGPHGLDAVYLRLSEAEENQIRKNSQPLA